MDMLPLRIEFTLATPWSPPALGLHLDGLIGWAVVEEAEAAAGGQTLPNADELVEDLPFEKYVTESGWCWKASLVRSVGVLGTERRYMTAKTAVSELSERMGDGRIAGRPLRQIDTVRGPFKNDAFWYTIEHAPRCVAYCMGDPERITALLDRVTHLGKYARLDHGRIAEITTHEDPAALEQWQQRNMPQPVNGHVPVQGRLRPPYWQGEGMGQVWRPL